MNDSTSKVNFLKLALLGCTGVILLFGCIGLTLIFFVSRSPWKVSDFFRVPLPDYISVVPDASPVIELVTFGQGDVDEIAFSPNANLLVAASSIGIWVYDANNLQKIHFIETEGPVQSIAFTPDGGILAAGDERGSIYLWKASDWQLVHTMAHNGRLQSVSFSSDGTTLASGGRGGEIRLWQVFDGNLMQT